MFARFAKSSDTNEKLEPESNSTRVSTELTGRIHVTTFVRPTMDDEGKGIKHWHADASGTPISGKTEAT